METAKLDLKKTVHLPRTDFPMKANLAQLEPKLLEQWKETAIYERIRESRQGRSMYVLHDGPPYANGTIHLGTAFNKVLKDFIVKSKTMEGFDSPYVPGWDCHGLPIENRVDNQLGPRKASMTTAQVREACRAYAEKYIDLQRKDFIRLGIFGRWQNPYLTMSAHYESVIAGTFVEFLSRGYVYKGLKPVNWCIHDRTALAEAEVEYENHTSPSIWVRFALNSDPSEIDPALAGKRVFGLIWTTTPWTIPANMAIAYHPKFNYVAAQIHEDVYIVAKLLLDATAEACGWSSPEVLTEFSGDRMNGTAFQHPFIERTSVGILGEHVTLEQGTGAVHTAPGHGQEDYEMGRQHGIPIYCPVDGAGKFYHAEGAPGRIPEELIGKTVWQANPVVNDLLSHHGALVASHKIEHSYPHCWRCHHPTIFRATEQWFIGMERNDLRARTLEAIKNVRWTPPSGELRMSNMIATRPDWCISRQRIWGTPITVFYCDSCQEPFTDRQVLDHVVSLFREHTADVWWDKSAAELMGPDAACAKCGARSFRKETDILDVWLESGCSHLETLTPENGLPWPADMYLEGGDQYRGWFHSSLLIGVGLRGAAPYRACATHGWTLDEYGHAMHKSKGNAIEPEDFTKQYGAELLRLWTASVDFTEDVRLSKTIIDRLVEAYRKLRNTFRYALGNLHDFDPSRDMIKPAEMPEIDRWILARAEDVIRRSRVHYENFEFHKVYRAVYDFATSDLSAVYFDVLKDRLYTSATRSHARRSGQTALYRIHYALTRLVAPLLAFTAEEVWGYTPKPAGAPGSVHMALFPEPEEVASALDADTLGRWDRLMEVREVVLKALEEARQVKFIGAPLEARLRLQAGPDLYPLLEQYAADLPALFIVSQVIVEHGDALAATVERADGQKCERCWKYSTLVGSDEEYPTVCDTCAAALREMRE
ncbi:MAG TPA: isoleucine--tRNA ligase [Bryobacteraceae bacterium]|nr:isoleucine--tRNA ligase [Bryobacteraceae bacterium]